MNFFYDFASRKKVALAENEVHLYRIFFSKQKQHLHDCLQLLSDTEKNDAAHFRFQTDRERFIIAHGMLRKVLSQYLDVSPAGLKFSHGVYGKPVLEGMPDGCSLCFNMSHSHDLALFALVWNSRIGVDVEYIRLIPDAEVIAKRFFTPQENSAFSAVSPDKKLEAFYNCWTRKEAFLKATGDGLSRRLDSFTVSLVPEEPVRLLSVEGDPLEASRWLFSAVEPAHQYVGAVVVEWG
ncbi:4'-phosphopantetheinyl transferase superfamily protein [Prosthecochloris sp. SCSIO W1101]|uniref:4'-phosphopantetheinyl transferase family protein n=1 Tax=Prosthecochloris sp. SCSIO W1101 TaxID=2992242 RepID=UPI00223E5DB1|nr:4'-phosphopantetheinyl transferase superfamily protein [Prosthecochloris sp. SCSIO W1101]UZJ40701.1 4'-phosphopantetheinyl transferase superfamily protein [Prosthecochloris sp. SCSIO W1101]